MFLSNYLTAKDVDTTSSNYTLMKYSISRSTSSILSNLGSSQTQMTFGWILLIMILLSSKITTKREAMIVIVAPVTEPRWPVFLMVQSPNPNNSYTWAFSNISATNSRISNTSSVFSAIAQKYSSWSQLKHSLNTTPNASPIESLTSEPSFQSNTTLSDSPPLPGHFKIGNIGQQLKTPLIDTSATPPASSQLNKNCVRADASVGSCVGAVIATSFRQRGPILATVTAVDSITNKTTVASIQFLIDYVQPGNDIRVNVHDLDAVKWQAFVTTLLKMKSSGLYDIFVAIHSASMKRLYDPSRINISISHGGPAFCPWYLTSHSLIVFEGIERSYVYLKQPGKCLTPHS